MENRKVEECKKVLHTSSLLWNISLHACSTARTSYMIIPKLKRAGKCASQLGINMMMVETAKTASQKAGEQYVSWCLWD